jgi:hypothetical protein
MKFGLRFGPRGVLGEPDSLGYEQFGMSDHVIVATEVESAKPHIPLDTPQTNGDGLTRSACRGGAGQP